MRVIQTFGDGVLSNQENPVPNAVLLLRSIAPLVIGAAALQAQTADRPTGFPASCAPAEVEVMLLGTYHFANPGRDVIKQDIDDVLDPKSGSRSSRTW